MSTLRSIIMKTDNTFTYKDPLWLMARLDTTLEKEKEKYRKCPVKPDLASGHEAAQGWGYVVAGYFLVKQSFKALLHIRGEKDVPKTHSLSYLFKKFDENDRKILRENYVDLACPRFHVQMIKVV